MTCPNPKCAQFIKDNKWITEQYMKLEKDLSIVKEENTFLLNELKFYKAELAQRNEECFNAKRESHMLKAQIDKANEDVYGR